MSQDTVNHLFHLKMLASDKNDLTQVREKKSDTFLQLHQKIDPKIDTKSFFRDVKVLLDQEHHKDPLKDIAFVFKSFWVTTGGMIEYPESSFEVINKRGVFGVLDNCLLEMDSVKRRCLRCFASHFYDEGAGKCVACKGQIEGCETCRKADWCDSCAGYHNRYGQGTCLKDLGECVAPKYSRYTSDRCDSCERSQPNGCRCSSNSKPTESALGKDLKMCVCKIDDCKSLS